MPGESENPTFLTREGQPLRPVDANRQMLDTGKRAFVGVLAGGAWFSWAVMVAHPGGLPALVVLITVGCLLLAGCVCCLLKGRKSPPDVAPQSRRGMILGFLMVSVFEGAAVGVAVMAAQKTGRLDLLPDWIGLVIGVHFFLLARVLRMPSYNLTGAAITLWCALSLVLFRGSDLTVAVGLGIGTILWTTAGFKLFRALRPAY